MGKAFKPSRVLPGLGVLGNEWKVTLGGQSAGRLGGGRGGRSSPYSQIPPTLWKKHGELNNIKLVAVPSQYLQLREGWKAWPPLKGVREMQTPWTRRRWQEWDIQVPSHPLCLTKLPSLKGLGALHSPQTSLPCGCFVVICNSTARSPVKYAKDRTKYSENF